MGIRKGLANTVFTDEGSTGKDFLVLQESKLILSTYSRTRRIIGRGITALKETVQRKLRGVQCGINRKISL
jgi:hypothetical protein